MLPVINPKTWATAIGAAMLISGVSGGIGYWRGNVKGQAKVQSQWDIAKAEAITAAANATTADQQTGQQASAEYQSERNKHAEQIRVVRQTVVRTVTGPCLDDGVREQINIAIRGVPGASPAR